VTQSSLAVVTEPPAVLGVATVKVVAAAHAAITIADFQILFTDPLLELSHR